MPDPAVTTVALDQMDGLDVARWPREQQHRLDVRTEHAVLPFLVVPRTGADGLLVLNNGAVDQSIAQGRPVFQRSSWSAEIRRHQIYFCDPGTLGDDRLSLAWGQLSGAHWVTRDAVRAVRALAAGLGATPAARRVYYGSSAGGFMALAMLADDPGAAAVVNNAQFDWTRWMATGLNPLREARFGNMLPARLRARHPLRTNALNLLAKRGHPVRIDYHVNLASEHDREIDRPMLDEFVRSHPELTAGVRVLPYEDPEARHNPLPKERTLELLDSAFSSP